MADSPAPAIGGDMSAQEKARLRRERRQAKINAGGASRLQAITQLQGGTHRDIEKDVPVKSSATPSGTATPDPDEIDISQHHYTPASQPRLPSPFDINGASAPPFPQPRGQGQDAAQDPIQAMMQQMLGGQGGGFPGMGGQPGQPPEGLPPGLANLFSAMNGGAGAQEPSPAQSSAWIWRLVHSVFSLVLSFYIVFQTPFNGSKLARTNPSTLEEDWTLDASPAETFRHFFYLFATFEVVLQSSRYFIEKGQLQGGGILSSVAGFLPEPYGGYVRTIGRYSIIYRTVVNDAMVVVFVLGAASWWRGGITY